jgi:hypothetical protein
MLRREREFYLPTNQDHIEKGLDRAWLSITGHEGTARVEHGTKKKVGELCAKRRETLHDARCARCVATLCVRAFALCAVAGDDSSPRNSGGWLSGRLN